MRTGEIGVGIIGLSAGGGWAAQAHVPALAKLSGYRLIALAASSVDSARAAGDQFGVGRVFDDPAALAACDDIDLVVVTVKVPQHRELVLPALAAGKAVLCEWPLGNGLAEAEELAAAATKAGVRGFAGLQARSGPAIRYVRDLVADGFVGTVLSSTVIGSGGNWGPLIDSRNAYTLDRANGATLLTIPFGHTMDAVAMTLGEFTSITATTAIRRPEVLNRDTGEMIRSTVADQIVVSAVADGGAVVCAHYRGGQSRGTNLLWEINGTDGDLVITADTGHLQMAGVTVRGARGADTELQELGVPAPYHLVDPADFADNPRALNVANAYAQIRADLAEGTRVAPTFDDAVVRHRFLDTIDRAHRR